MQLKTSCGFLYTDIMLTDQHIILCEPNFSTPTKPTDGNGFDFGWILHDPAGSVLIYEIHTLAPTPNLEMQDSLLDLN